MRNAILVQLICLSFLVLVTAVGSLESTPASPDVAPEFRLTPKSKRTSNDFAIEHKVSVNATGSAALNASVPFASLQSESLDLEADEDEFGPDEEEDTGTEFEEEEDENIEEAQTTQTTLTPGRAQNVGVNQSNGPVPSRPQNVGANQSNGPENLKSQAEGLTSNRSIVSATQAHQDMAGVEKEDEDFDPCQSPHDVKGNVNLNKTLHIVGSRRNIASSLNGMYEASGVRNCRPLFRANTSNYSMWFEGGRHCDRLVGKSQRVGKGCWLLGDSGQQQAYAFLETTASSPHLSDGIWREMVGSGAFEQNMRMQALDPEVQLDVVMPREYRSHPFCKQAAKLISSPSVLNTKIVFKSSATSCHFNLAYLEFMIPQLATHIKERPASGGALMLETGTARAFVQLVQIVSGIKTKVGGLAQLLDLLWLAQSFGLQEVSKVLEKQVEKNLTTETLGEVLAFSTAKGLQSIKDLCMQQALKNFEAFSHTDGFLVMQEGTVAVLLADDKLVASGEEAVLEALLRWYSRAGCLKDNLLLEHVRFAHISTSRIASSYRQWFSTLNSHCNATELNQNFMLRLLEAAYLKEVTNVPPRAGNFKSTREGSSTWTSFQSALSLTESWAGIAVMVIVASMLWAGRSLISTS